MILPLEPKLLAAYRRKAKRRVAAAIVTAMAETDSSFDDIGAALQKPPESIRAFLHGLIEGKGEGDLEDISDVMLAMDCELSFGIRDIEPQQAEVPDGQE